MTLATWLNRQDWWYSLFFLTWKRFPHYFTCVGFVFFFCNPEQTVEQICRWFEAPWRHVTPQLYFVVVVLLLLLLLCMLCITSNADPKEIRDITWSSLHLQYTKFTPARLPNAGETWCVTPLLMPQSHQTPGPRTGCSRAVYWLFWTKIVRPPMGPRAAPYEFCIPVWDP